MRSTRRPLPRGWQTRAPTVTDPGDKAKATSDLADLYRRGLHDLAPWWSPDIDGMVDPLDDPEVRTEVRRYFRRRITELQEARRG